MKLTILFLVFIGILFMTIDIVKSLNKCKDKQIIYKYIPRSFEEEQDEPVYVSDIFKTMFSQQSPWVYSVQNFDRKKHEDINKFFASQY